jgi:hypothetical protein
MARRSEEIGKDIGAGGTVPCFDFSPGIASREFGRTVAAYDVFGVQSGIARHCLELTSRGRRPLN